MSRIIIVDNCNSCPYMRYEANNAVAPATHQTFYCTYKNNKAGLVKIPIGTLVGVIEIPETCPLIRVDPKFEDV